MRCRILRMVLWVGVVALPCGSTSAQEGWVYQYNSPADLMDLARSIVLGPDGCVYAAGMSETEGWDSDFTMVKLTSSGDPVWVYHYNSPGDGEDWLNSILMGTDSNLYATGSTEENAGSYAFTVISLDTAATERWIRRYGPGCGTSVVAGASGALYAAGARGRTGYPYSEFAVIGLDTSGTEQWGYRHYGRGRGESIVVGSDGNLYAGGISWANGGPEASFTVISLTRLGDERWVYQLDGQGEAYSIIMGTDGNLYAAGYSAGIGGTGDFSVLGLTPSGDSLWVYQYDGPGQGWEDCAFSIAEGPDSNLYVAGMSEGDETWSDFTVVRLTRSGEECWVRRYPPIELMPEHDVARSIAVGADGTVYAAGTCHDDTMTLETRFTVVSLTPSGGERWVYHYGLPGGGLEHGAHSIIVGADGNVYAAGASETGVAFYDFTVVSLAPGVGVEEGINDQPSMTNVQLLQNAPNPFTHMTRITYRIPSAVGGRRTAVTLRVYDLSGRLIRTLVDCPLRTAYSLLPTCVLWHGTNDRGERVATGVYFYRLTAGDFTATKKLILLR